MDIHAIMTSQQLFIIDNDCGTDDAQAILMALAQPNIRVLALTTVAGNATVDDVTLNCIRVLRVAQRLDIPIYEGCSVPLIGHTAEQHVGNGFHGGDGLGDAPDDVTPDRNLVQKEHAANTLVTLANEFPGQINLVALGPLTNLALAIRLDPHFGSKLKHCYIMGGNMTGRGNRTVSAEFNFVCDPEAAHVVLNELECPISLATLEFCQQHFLDWDFYESKFLAVNTDICRFVKKIDEKIAHKFKVTFASDRYWAWDQVIMAVAINNAAALEKEPVYATVELHGGLTRGQVVVDWNKKLEKKPNVFLLRKLDEDLYRKLLIQAMHGKPDF